MADPVETFELPFPAQSDCNYVDLPFEYAFEYDGWFQEKCLGPPGVNMPAPEVCAEFAKAVFVEGGKHYRKAWKKFCPDYPIEIAEYLWFDGGVEELHDYMGTVRDSIDEQNQKPKRAVIPVDPFLPNHDFGNDPCYEFLVKGVDPRFVEISKAHALGSSVGAAIRQVIPSMANDDAAVHKEDNRWRRSSRAVALHQYLAVLVTAKAVSEGPRELKDYNDAIEKMFWQTTDVDARLKLHRTITGFKNYSAAHTFAGGGMPADFDTSGLED